MSDDKLSNFKFTMSFGDKDLKTKQPLDPENSTEGEITFETKLIGGDDPDFFGWLAEGFEVKPEDKLLEVKFIDGDGNQVDSCRALVDFERDKANPSICNLKIRPVCEKCLEPFDSVGGYNHPVDLIDSDGLALLFWSPWGKCPITPRPLDFVELSIDLETRWKVIEVRDNLLRAILPGDECEIEACKCKIVGLWRPLFLLGSS